MSSMDEYYDAEMIDRLTAAACENADLKAERDRLREALQWYEEIVGECNRRGQEGEDARNALAQDVGARARTALQEDRDE